jgi:hypothetical protein
VVGGITAPFLTSALDECELLRDFTYNMMVLRLTTIDMSGRTWMTLNLGDG